LRSAVRSTRKMRNATGRTAVSEQPRQRMPPSATRNRAFAFFTPATNSSRHACALVAHHTCLAFRRVVSRETPPESRIASFNSSRFAESSCCCSPVPQRAVPRPRRPQHGESRSVCAECFLRWRGGGCCRDRLVESPGDAHGAFWWYGFLAGVAGPEVRRVLPPVSPRPVTRFRYGHAHAEADRTNPCQDRGEPNSAG